MLYNSPLLAEMYDLDCGGLVDDIPFYDSLAHRAGAPALELGVGTGRVAIPLARAGHDVWGLDCSDAMLSRARCRASREGVTVELRKGSIARFDLGRTFCLIYAAFGTFHHLLTSEDQRACFRSVSEHLAPGGIVGFDLRPLHFEDWEEGESVPVFHDWTRTRSSTGETVMKSRAVRNDSATRTKRETQAFDIIAGDGSVRRSLHEIELRFFSAGELHELVEGAGLTVQGVYGNYDCEPYDESSDHLIVVARKLSEAQ